MQGRKEQKHSRPGITWKLLNKLIRDLFCPQNLSKRKSKSTLNHEGGEAKKTDHDHGEVKKTDHDHGEANLEFLCGICFDDNPRSDTFKEGKCNHLFCTHCISKYAANQIHQNILKVKCPDPNCSVELKPEYLHPILPREVIDRWERAICESSIAVSKKTYCPFKDCSVLLVNDGKKVVTSAECPSCHRLFCAKCKVPWHAGKTCKQYQRGIKGVKEMDNMFFNLAMNQNWQRCPQCTMFVQRSTGCNSIACRCGCHFCYYCGEELINYGHLLCQQRPPSRTVYNSQIKRFFSFMIRS